MKHFLSNWRWRMREFLGVMREMRYIPVILLLIVFAAFAQFMATTLMLCVGAANLNAADSADNNNVAANTATTMRVLEHQRSMNMRILFR